METEWFFHEGDFFSYTDLGCFSDVLDLLGMTSSPVMNAINSHYL